MNSKRILVSLLFIVFFQLFAISQDLVLVNGTTIDGSGKLRSLANVRIREGKIADIGPFKPVAGENTLDVKGMIVAPGFVDFQSLSPFAVDNEPGSLITQLITTE